MAQFDTVIFQKNAADEWKEYILVPNANEFIGFDGTKLIVSKSVGSATPLAHQSTHLSGGSDPIGWDTTIHMKGTTAARPAAAASNAGYLYWATDDDGGTLFRSTGAVWEAIARGLTEAPPLHASTHLAGGTDAMTWTLVLGRDTLANRPAAAATNTGYLYFATDVNGGTWFQSDGAAWQTNSIGLTAVRTVPVGGTGVATLDGFVYGNGAAAMTAVKANLGAVVDPTVNEDSGDGYGIGSIWVNTATKNIFFATDVTVGAAVWRIVTPPSVDTFTITNMTTTPYSLLTTDRLVEVNLAAPGASTIFLPDLAGVDAGQKFTVVDGTGDAGTNTITITCFGAQTANGLGSLTITNNYGSISFYKSTATRWRVNY